MSSSSVSVGTLNVKSIISDSTLNISSSTNSIQLGDYTLPSSVPSETSVLSTDASGILSFIPANVKADVTTSSYTIDANDSVVSITAVQPTITLTLPDPLIKIVGDVLYIRREVAGTNPVTIVPSGTETVSGQNSISITEEYGSVSLYTNGTNWFLL